MKNKGRKNYCKTCSYITAHPRCGINRMLLEGTMTCREIAKHFNGEAGAEKTIKRHRDLQHGVNRQLRQAKASRDAKAGLELAECIKEVWSDSQEAIDYALGRKAPPETNPLNLNVFGQCIAPRTKIIEILARVAPNESNEPESDGFMEALKANAKDDWKEARSVQVASTEQKTASSDALVDD